MLQTIVFLSNRHKTVLFIPEISGILKVFIPLQRHMGKIVKVNAVYLHMYQSIN